MADNVYGCLYFKSDKIVSIIPKSRRIKVDAFKTPGEVEVKWRVHGKQQLFVGMILQVSSKRQ